MWKGYFHQHRACLRLKIHATEAVRESGKVNFIDMPAIIDTGFDGFVQIDLQMAIALGWLAKKVNLGVTRVADGKLIPVGLFNSPVMIGQDAVVGLCQFPISKTLLA